MKKKILEVAAVLLIISLLAFKKNTWEPTAATAQVQQVNGLLIFCNSTPVKDYEYLGTVREKKVNWSGCDLDHKQMMQELTYLAAKKYPGSTAIIYNDGITADAVKIKE